MATKRSPCSPQLEKASGQQRRPNAAIRRKKKNPQFNINYAKEDLDAGAEIKSRGSASPEQVHSQW